MKPERKKPRKKRLSNEANKVRTMQRAEDILRIRLDGAEFWDVREYVREKHKEAGSCWHSTKMLSDGQIWRYIKKSDELIAESCCKNRAQLMRRHLAQRRNLFAKAVAQADLGIALAVIRDEAALQGLYPAKKAELTGKNGGPIETKNDHSGTVSVLSRIDQLAGAYVGAANREEAGDPASDGSRKPVDTGPG